MAITFSELHDTGGTVYDTSGPSSATAAGSVRRFIAPGYSPEDAIAAARQAANGELNNKAPHPRATSLRLSTLEPEGRVGNDSSGYGWTIRATYVPVGSPNINFPPDRNAVGFTTVEQSFYQIEIDIPFVTKRYVAFDQADALVYEEEYSWTIAKKMVPAVRMTCQVNVSNWNPSHAAVVAQQVGKIHQFQQYGSTEWLFLGANTIQTTKDLWSVNYAWLTEPGNDVPAQPTAPPSALIQYVPIPARPPHAKYVVLNTSDQVDPVLVIGTWRDIEVDPGGYLGLPGHPLSLTVPVSPNSL